MEAGMHLPIMIKGRSWNLRDQSERYGNGEGKGGWIMNKTMDNATAYYFGVEVKVLCTLENCSLIRFASREFIVEKADLEFVRILEQAA